MDNVIFLVIFKINQNNRSQD